MEKIAALRYAIRVLEKKQAMMSVDGKRLQPLDQYGKEFYELEDAIIQLKALCQAMQSELVRKSIAEWDMAIAESVEPEMRL